MGCPAVQFRRQHLNQPKNTVGIPRMANIQCVMDIVRLALSRLEDNKSQQSKNPYVLGIFGVKYPRVNFMVRKVNRITHHKQEV